MFFSLFLYFLSKIGDTFTLKMGVKCNLGRAKNVSFFDLLMKGVREMK